MSKFENIVNAFGLINAAIPSVAKVIVTLKNGKEINLNDLIKSTENIIAEKLKEAQEHLAKPGSSDG